jgi:hypothetical protein
VDDLFVNPWIIYRGDLMARPVPWARVLVDYFDL